jgi:putative FmdB family regulatory protein
MPTYEYECKKCGYNFEVFQSMSDEPLKTCVKCGNEVRRLILGGAGVIFKGSGFYVTDKVADKAADKAAGKGKGPDSKTAATESKTTETSGTTQNTSASPTGGDTTKAAGDSGAMPSAKAAAKTSVPTA